MLRPPIAFPLLLSLMAGAAAQSGDIARKEVLAAPPTRAARSTARSAGPGTRHSTPALPAVAPHTTARVPVVVQAARDEAHARAVSDLRRAILRANPAALRALIAARPSLLDVTLDRSSLFAPRGTPLHLAVDRDQTEVAMALVALGANVNARDTLGRTPMHAVRSRKMVLLLAEAGADPTTVDQRGDSPLETFSWHTQAVGRDVARALSATGVDLELFEAVQFDFQRDVDRLLRFGAGPVERSHALWLAASQGKTSMVERLLKTGASPAAPPPRFGHAPLGTSAAKASILERAIHAGHADVATLLLASEELEGIDTMVHHGVGWRPEDSMSRTRRGDLFDRAVDEGAVELIEPLLRAGLDFEPVAATYGLALRASPHGPMLAERPIVRAAWRGHTELVERLIEAGESIDAASRGATSLQAAASAGHDRLVARLLELGARPNVHALATIGAKSALAREIDAQPWLLNERDARLQRTPIAWAIHRGRIETVRMLIRMGADLRHLEPAGRIHPARWRTGAGSLMPAAGEIRFRAETERVSLVAMAVYLGELTIASELIDAGAAIDRATIELLCASKEPEATPLLAASLSGPVPFALDRGWAHPGLVQLLTADLIERERLSRLELLLDAGAAVDLVDEDDRSVLALAASRRVHDAVARRLATVGAPVTIEIALGLGWDRHVESLLRSGNVEHRQVRSTIARAASEDRIGIVRQLNAFLGGNTNVRLRKVAMNAAFHGATEVVAYAISERALDLRGDGVELLQRSASAPEPELVRWLIDQGVDPNARGRNGETALHHACKFWNPHGSVEALLRAGGDANARDNRGDTPLVELLGQRVGPDAPAAVRMLLEAGADPFAVGYGGKSAFDLAFGLRGDFAIRWEVIDAFREYVPPHLFPQ